MSSIAASLISTSLLHFTFLSLLQRCSKAFVCLLICGYKTYSQSEKSPSTSNFHGGGRFFEKFLLLLWVRNEGLWLCLQLVWWTLRNNNMVTAAMMLSSIIFQKLNTGWEKNVFVPRSSSVSWINKKINVNRLRIIKSKLLQLCSHAEYKYLIVSIWRWGFFW